MLGTVDLVLVRRAALFFLSLGFVSHATAPDRAGSASTSVGAALTSSQYTFPDLTHASICQAMVLSYDEPWNRKTPRK